MLKSSRGKNLFWLAAYLATMAIAFGLLLRGGDAVVATWSAPEERAKWETYAQTEAARQSNPNAPVRRRSPPPGEPPALILMRDHLAPIAGLTLAVTSLIFGFGMLAVRAFKSP